MRAPASRAGLVVVTGATKGIGRAIAERFSRGGHPVAMCARSSADLIALRAEMLDASDGAAEVHCMRCDVSEKDDVLAFGEWVTSLEENVEVLVNNAGVFLPGPLLAEDDGALDLLMRTNVYSAYHLTRALAPAMIERRRGHIFNMCSVASIMPYTSGSSYCVSKFALLGMSKVLREELKEHRVRVTSVLPGATLTATWDGVDLPEERFARSEDVAEAVWGAHELSERTVVEELVIRPMEGDI
tara:strand:+ start:169 stop:897 length:729 start_codon:yes stop_codon:yes gene_type:complete